MAPQAKQLQIFSGPGTQLSLIQDNQNRRNTLQAT